MTNTINRLADDLIALINSKPRSPTKDEILEVLRGALAVALLEKASKTPHPGHVTWIPIINDCQGETGFPQHTHTITVGSIGGTVAELPPHQHHANYTWGPDGMARPLRR